MVTLTFAKAESQISERTGKPYSRNVRYDEVETTFFGKWFPPKQLIQQACDGDLPDTITMTIE